MKTDSILDVLQREAFEYFRSETNPRNGLVADSTRPGSPCSIAAVGLALACYPVAVERGFLRRTEALHRALAALRFFDDSAQQNQRSDGHSSDDAPDTEQAATEHRGFYYHFLDMDAGRRVGRCELSTVDTALLLAGALAAARYFDRDAGRERELRQRTETLARRADWRWAQNGGDGVSHGGVSHGWKPESGFLKSRWHGYNEALILLALGLGSPDHALSPQAYSAWTQTYRWRKIYGHELLWCGPLFTHQFSHLWIDFRGIQDDFMRAHHSDYFENSRRATLVQQQYALRNPRGWRGYGKFGWGLTACEGPGPAQREAGGRTRRFFDYRARGAPFGPDDGTLTPWAVIASLPFAPEIVLSFIAHHMAHRAAHDDLQQAARALLTTHNPSFPAAPDSGAATGAGGWRSPHRFALAHGPVVLMIENYRSGLLWELMRGCSHIVNGLRRAGFRGSWLDANE